MTLITEYFATNEVSVRNNIVLLDKVTLVKDVNNKLKTDDKFDTVAILLDKNKIEFWSDNISTPVETVKFKITFLED